MKRSEIKKRERWETEISKTKSNVIRDFLSFSISREVFLIELGFVYVSTTREIKIYLPNQAREKKDEIGDVGVEYGAGRGDEKNVKGE